MNAEQRAGLIRERFKAKGGSPYVSRPAKPKSDWKPRGYFLISFGNANDARRPDWLKTPDAAPKVIPKPEHRRKGQNALERIAAHYPVRLR